MDKTFKLGDEVVIIENDFTRQVVKLDSEDLVYAVNLSLHYEKQAQLYHRSAIAKIQQSNELIELVLDTVIVNSIINHCKTGK